MLKGLFSKLTGGTKPDPTSREEPVGGTPTPTLASLRQIAESKRHEDPLIGAKIGGKEVFRRMAYVMTTDQGVHAESLLCALGTLAGYSCQASLRALAIKEGAPELAPFDIITAQDGRQYFQGEPLRRVLLEDKYSVWHIIAEVARQAGCKSLPDVADITRYVANTIGQEHFGVPRLPTEHRPHDMPLRYLEAYWPIAKPVAQQLCQTAAEWPVLFSLAIQEAIYAGQDIIEPGLAVAIVMESATPMACIDLDNNG